MRRLVLALCLCPFAVTAQEGADIVILGEIHDNPGHHLSQAGIIAALNPAAVVYEMLDPAQVTAAAGVDRSDAAALGAALDWEESGWPDFAIYAPVFAAAPDAALYGAALARSEIRAAIDKGAAAVFGAGAEDWGLGDLPADIAAGLAEEMQAAHCGALPQEMMAGMVEAQRLRDAHFALVAAEAFDAHGGPVVVVTGNGHARRDRAIPHVLGLARPDLAVWSLGQFEGAPDAADLALYDDHRISPAAEREDPCAGF